MNAHRIVYILISVQLFIACSSVDQNSSVVDTSDSLHTDLNIQKTILLDHGFKIDAGQREDFKGFETYTWFRLSRAGQELYLDTSLTEYECGDTLYPLIRARNNGTYDILVEINDRPSKNYLRYFSIKNDKVVSIQKLPTFDSGSSNLDEDVKLEFIGTWDWGETWGDNGNLTPYNPMIVYEDTPEGFRLDTILTIRRNREKYGKFHGYKYDENIAIDVKDIKADR